MIRQRLERLKHLERRADEEHYTRALDKVKLSLTIPPSRPFALQYLKETREELDKAQAEYQREYAALTKIIGKLDERQQMILKLRYFDCLKWEVIAQRMNYSVASVYRLHRDALDGLDGTADN